MNHTFTFEYDKQEYYEKYADFVGEQVEKHYDFIRSAVAFIGWQVSNRPFSKRFYIKLEFEPMGESGKETILVLMMQLSGKNPEKIEFSLNDETDLGNPIPLGRLVFHELPSWNNEDDKKFLEHLKSKKRLEE